MSQIFNDGSELVDIPWGDVEIFFQPIFYGRCGGGGLPWSLCFDLVADVFADLVE